MTREPTRWTEDTIARTVGTITPEEITEATAQEDDPPELWPYLDAASVLTTFDPRTLVPTEATPLDATEAIAGLLGSSAALSGDENRAQWTLTGDARRAALARLGTRSAMEAALARNPDRPRDRAQSAFEAVMTGTTPPVADQDETQLRDTLQAATWLAGILPDVPDPAAVRRALEREALLAPFRLLVGDHFGGRRKQLAQLRSYVDVLTTDSALEAFGRAIRGDRRLPLLIHGVGGIGKSTLVAKFILDHTQPGADSELAFAYIDLDRAGVLPEEPVTLLHEAARQLAIQGELDGAELEPRILADREHLAAAAREQAGAPGVKRVPATFGYSRRSPFVDAFVEAVNATTSEEHPFLLVLDTFEEVQFRSAEVVRELGLFLDALHERLPFMRTVLAGRVPIDDIRTEDLELEFLDEDAALGFLRAHGVEDSTTARLIVSRLKGNPLTLALAARAIRQDARELDTISTMRRRKMLFLPIGEEAIQGYLYRRILGHVHDLDVRRLAHPGLVVRRIDPDVIRHVLAGPCGLEIADAAEATRLFEALRKEVTLVKPGGDALEHRADVRRLVLPLVQRDMPAEAEAIHRNAVDYYAQRDGLIDRAEEIYHRLFVDDLRDAVEDRWNPTLEESLAGALDELPPEGQVVLAPLVKREPSDPTVWRRASGRSQERRLEQRVEDLVGLGRADEALDVLRKGPVDRTPAGRLFVLEALALVELRRFDAARDAIARGLDAADEPGGGPIALELLELSARVEQDAGDPAAARGRLLDTYRAAKQLRQRDKQLETGARLARQFTGDEGAAVLDELRDDFKAMPEDVLRARPALAREYAQAVRAEEDHEVSQHAARTVGLSGLTDSVLRARVEALERQLAFVETPQSWLGDLLAAVRDDVALELDRTIGREALRLRDELRRTAQALYSGEGDARVVEDSWRRYAQLRDAAQHIFDEAVEIAGGLAARARGVDQHLGELADELIRTCARESVGMLWHGCTIPTRYAGSPSRVTTIVRLPFPDWSLWTLPLAVHGYAHVALDELTRTDRLTQALRETGAGRRLTRRQVSELLADVFATFVIGPAYSCAALLLGLNPAEGRHVARAYVVIATLRHMDTADWLRPQRDRLEELWQQAVQRAGDLGTEVIDDDGDLDVLVQTALEFFRAELLARAGYMEPGVAHHAMRIADALKHGLPPESFANQMTLKEVLNGAWLCRMQSPEETARIEAASLAACRLVVEARPRATPSSRWR